MVIIADDVRRNAIRARLNRKSPRYVSRGADEGVKFASSLGISSSSSPLSSSSSAGTAIIVAIRIRRAQALQQESTVSPEFQIIHGSWTKRLLHTLPTSAGAVIIVIREEAENVRAAAPIRAFQFVVL